MSEKKIDENLKRQIIDSFLDHKKEVLADYREDQQRKLDYASNDDIDHRHIDSKNEETLSELDFLNKSIDLLEKEITHLREIPAKEESESVQFGCLVETDKNLVLIGAAQETMQVDGQKVTGISMASPLFHAMEGKKVGDEVEVNGMKHKILSIV